MGEIEARDKEKSIEDFRDVEELRLVLKAISDFLRDIKEPISDLLNLILGSLRGDQLGEDVANFYKKLKEAGMSEEQARELTREYFERRMIISELTGKLPSLISEAIRGRTPSRRVAPILTEKTGEKKEEAKQEEP